MTIRRKVLIIAGALALVLGASIALLLTNINWIVRSAIERYGSQATGTRVQVAHVDIRLSGGSGAVGGLTVANPEGFSSSPLLSLGSISIRIEPRTVLSDVVVIDTIRILKPQVDYEMDASGRSNVDAVRKRIGSAAQAPEKQPAGRKTAKRLRIRTLVIENGRADLRFAALGDRPRSVTLDRIELRDIGGRDGATPDEAARQIIGAILSETGRKATQAGTDRLIRKGLDRILGR